MIEIYTTPLSADEFQQALFEDRFPVTYHDCEKVATIIEQALAEDGYYTIEAMRDDLGHIVTAYSKDKTIIAYFVINRPTVAENRRIPSVPWLRMKFKKLGYDFKYRGIRSVAKEIEAHIRDGGTWVLLEAPDTIVFELSIRDKVKTKLTYYKEDLFL